MKDQEWNNFVAVGVAVAVIAGFLIGIAALPSRAATPTAPTGGTGATDYLYLTISFNPGSGMDLYSPSNFSVPSHTLIEVKIITYDNGTNVVSGAGAMVTGTVNGYATVTGPNGSSVRYTSLPPTGIAHTFTVLSGPRTVLNVPIPPSPSLVDSLSVSFEAYFSQPGTFTWMCLAPCDPGAMTSPGFMTGTLTVD